MNTKTGKEIGHPSGHYSWDIVGVAEHCFATSGIAATIYVGPGYVTRARSTAAQANRETGKNIIQLDSYEFDQEVTGHLLYADADGTWKYTTTSKEIDVDWDQLPFGPVVLHIHSITRQQGFPAQTLRYLVDTLERGEEPMEIRGRNNYSTVSGWKAFARWMQSYAVPLPNVQHPHLQQIPDLLLERRTHFLTFLQELCDSELLDNQQQPLIEGLHGKYAQVVNTFEKHLHGDISLTDVRTCYFAEQKTLTYYKKLDTYLTHQLEM